MEPFKSCKLTNSIQPDISSALAAILLYSSLVITYFFPLSESVELTNKYPDAVPKNFS